MDFREYRVVRDGNEIVVIGTIREPVRWDFSIRMCEDDLAGVARVAIQRPVLGLMLRSLFKRRKAHHWNQDRAEHLAAARAARRATFEKPVDELLEQAGAGTPRAKRLQAVDDDAEAEAPPRRRLGFGSRRGAVAADPPAPGDSPDTADQSDSAVS